MTPQEKAQQLYRDAYMRWCYELSHDKNVLTAKSICEYICNEVLGYMGADRGYEFWCYVRDHIRKSNHNELYNGSDKTKTSYSYTIQQCPGYEGHTPESLSHEVCKWCGSIKYYH